MSENDEAGNLAAGAPSGRSADIVLWRQLHWIIYAAEETLGLRPGGHLEIEREALPLIDRLDEVLRTALRSEGKLDPFRYRAVWTIKNMMGKYGATALY